MRRSRRRSAPTVGAGDPHHGGRPSKCGLPVSGTEGCEQPVPSAGREARHAAWLHARRAARLAAAMPTQSALRVLVIDDEKNIRSTVSLCLEGLGCTVTGVASAEAARAAVAASAYDLAFLDLRLGDASGLDLLPELLGRRPDLDVVIITAYATIDTAVEAMRRGARDYLPKPFTPAQIRLVVEQVAERQRLVRRVAELQSELATAAPEIDLDSAAPAMRAVLDVLSRVAASGARSTPAARARRARSSPSTARRCPRSCWPASSSAMCAAPSPARCATSR